jgi:cleavage and polyadenylation specificity factor subunit 6/7
VEVKFFENRANGQSKGFCVITLGSEPSMRMCMERLPKKELHGQCPVVTFPTKQALNQVSSFCLCSFYLHLCIPISLIIS